MMKRIAIESFDVSPTSLFGVTLPYEICVVIGQHSVEV